MVWACFLEKPFEVLGRGPHLTLVAMCGGQGAPHTRAACLTIVANSHGCGLLMALFVPLSTAFDALLGAMGGDVEWRPPVTAQGCLLASLGRAKLDHLIAGGALGGDVA
jgi:hypothetical protein